LIGAVAGLLLAPYAGADLQQRIRSWAENLLEKGQQAAATKRAELEAQLEAFKQGRPVILQDYEGSAKES